MLALLHYHFYGNVSITAVEQPKGWKQTIRSSRLLFTLPNHGVAIAKPEDGRLLFAFWPIIEKLAALGCEAQRIA
ncbi:MAG: hypothetical protein PHO37_14265 [Kiritimatiellae bacterium]|nr:hypothetical protein [Kiritimatiellia bacterium]